MYSYFTLGVCINAQTADITPRKTQLFQLIHVETCFWTTTGDNSLIAIGAAEVDFDLLITISVVSLLTGEGTLLSVDDCLNL